jgi:hypothetical protein
MARKKANKRARELGLPPPGVTPPPGVPSNGAPKEGGAATGSSYAKAAAEAALSRFAGFEDHTSGVEWEVICFCELMQFSCVLS